MDGGPDPTAALVELVEDAPCGIVVTDPDGQLLYVNETLKRWLDLPGDYHSRLKRLPDLMTTPGRLYFETNLAPMMRIQGFVREISCSLNVADGAALPVLLSGAARYDAAGNLVRCDYMIFDARERRMYEEELRTAQRKADELAAIVRTSPNAILRVDRTGIIRSWNSGAERLLGPAAGAVVGRPVEDIIQFEDQPDWFGRAVASCKSGIEAVLETADGQGHHFEVTVVPIDEHAAAPTGCYSVVLRDISDRKRAEQRLQVAMAELKHRVKNTFAVITGIARQTLPADAREDFIRRLHALSRANDMLTNADERAADLTDLLALTAQEAGGAERFRISGPSVRLSPEQATSLSMALHELATNALKYGALSRPEGYVQVDCERSGQGDGRLKLVWQERDGPPVVPPRHQGFGSKMINTVLKAHLSADVVFDYRPEGIRCVVVFETSEHA